MCCLTALPSAYSLRFASGARCSSRARRGSGKTEVAKTLASLLGRRLIRLQCYEGLDIASAAYEWNYARQMMQIQSAGQGVLSSADLFTADNLIERRCRSAA